MFWSKDTPNSGRPIEVGDQLNTFIESKQRFALRAILEKTIPVDIEHWRPFKTWIGLQSRYLCTMKEFFLISELNLWLFSKYKITGDNKIDHLSL